MKSLVIHSLPRAGGTMLERLIDSQSDMACAPFLFNVNEMASNLEAAQATRNRANTPIEEIRLDVRRHTLQMQVLHMLSTAVGTNPYLDSRPPVSLDMLVCGVSLRRWYDALAHLATTTDPENLQDPLFTLARYFKLHVFASHWTKSLWYAPRFLESEHAYWIELLRDPYDRLISERKTAPNGKMIERLDASNEQFRFVETFHHPRFIVVKYEDFCADPTAETARLSDWLKEPVSLVPLTNMYGEAFYPNSSKAVDAGKSYMFQDPNSGSHIGSVPVDRWNAERTPVFVASVNAAVDTRGQYPCVQTSVLSMLRGRMAVARMRSRERLRDAFVQMFALGGVNISRNVLD